MSPASPVPQTVFTTVSPTPVYASELEHFGNMQDMAKSQMAKVVASLANIAVFGVKESAQVAAGKVLAEIASGKYNAVAKDDSKKLSNQNVPPAWADSLRMFPPPGATKANGQQYAAA